MLKIIKIVLIVIFVNYTLPIYAAEMKIHESGIAYIDNEPTFILGLYELPAEDDILKQVADAGFNLIQSTQDKNTLDRIDKFGLNAWINTGSRILVPPDNASKALDLRAMAKLFSDHPAFALWEVPDEILWNVWRNSKHWRHFEEPKILREKIQALKDIKSREDLITELDKAVSLLREGYYQTSEEIADSIWQKLGEESPKPGIGLSNAEETSKKLLLQLITGHQIIKLHDKTHPVWMNHAPRNNLNQLQNFSMAADIIGCDIYPVPESPNNSHSDLKNKSLSCVGEYTYRMRYAARKNPVWMVLQGFGWKDLGEEYPQTNRRPTYNESRFMAWDAIVRGAKGILYWGTFKIEKDSQLWKDLLLVVREIANLSDILEAPTVSEKPEIHYQTNYNSIDEGVAVLQKKLDDKLHIIAVNESQTPITFAIDGLDDYEGIIYKDVKYSNAQPKVTDGQLVLAMPPYSVYILSPQE